MSFCLTLCKTKTDLEVSVFKSVKEINQEDWNTVVKDKNIYQCLDYLSALEENLCDKIVFRYLMFYNAESKPVAVAIVQSLPFEDKGLEDQAQVSEMRDKIKHHFVKAMDLRVMTCGSPFASGENGFSFTEDISEVQAYESLSKALTQLQKSEKDDIKAQIILLKEFWPHSFDSCNSILTKEFKEFQIDVNMVMQIRPQWQSMDGYLQSMTTKFRTKAKSAIKKSNDLTIKRFELEEVLLHKDKIQDLYLSVVAKSDSKFGELNGNTFVSLKRNLGDKFVITGYLLEGELVGFSSAFICNDVVDANYVGINYELNHKYAIYQRMLYDYVDLAIESNSTELRLGRTAEEIKSTIGAEPVEMTLYVRHKNQITNKFLKSIFSSIKPSEFQLRRPFKAVEYTKA